MKKLSMLPCVALLATSTCFSQPAAVSNPFAVRQPTDYRDNSGDLPGTETNTGLLVTGCVVAGGSIITSLVIPLPTPELFLQNEEIRSQSDRLLAFKKPVKVGREGDPTYGMVQSLDSSTLRLKTRDNEVQINSSDVNNIMDLASAADRSRTSRIKTAVLLGGGGLGVILVAASQTNTGTTDASVEDASATAKALLYAAGGILVVAGGWTILSRSDDEKELEAWEDQALGKPAQSSRFFNDLRMNVAILPVKTVHASGGCATELMPCVQAGIGLDF